jgi:hypothetical protein
MFKKVLDPPVMDAWVELPNIDLQDEGPAHVHIGVVARRASLDTSKRASMRHEIAKKTKEDSTLDSLQFVARNSNRSRLFPRHNQEHRIVKIYRIRCQVYEFDLGDTEEVSKSSQRINWKNGTDHFRNFRVDRWIRVVTNSSICSPSKRYLFDKLRSLAFDKKWEFQTKNDFGTPYSASMRSRNDKLGFDLSFSTNDK